MNSKLKFASMLFAALLMVGCQGSKDDPETPSNPSGTVKESHDKTASMYVGVTGFNNQLFHYTGDANKRYDILNKSTLSSYTKFVKSLNMANNTALFWAVDDNVDHLQYCQFPQDIENVSIVTFTDGLENGSGDFNERFLDIADYEKNLEYLNKKISNTSVQGIKLTAYSIGVQGSDVTNVKRFDNTLAQLSSGKGYNNKVENMTQLNETFKKIADDLYKQNSKPQLTVAVPPQVRKERIVFDQKSATESKIYIEATKLKDSPLKYSNITYVGCKSDSGTEVEGTKNNQGSTVFVFDNFTNLNGEKLSFTSTDLWYWDGTEWAHDAEYDGKNGARTEEVHKSAAIMLILDCSKSLEEQNRFADVKAAAVKFLETLAGNENSNPNPNPDPDPNPNPDPDPQDNQPHCWEVTITYSYYQQTEAIYVWMPEAELKSIIQGLKNEEGIANVTYNRASANDENSCEALNDPQSQYPDIYIKHPWGTGADADWKWKQMSTDDGNTYYYEGRWGGVGANINTSASDAGAMWYPQSDIYGAYEVEVGESVVFYFDLNSAEMWVSPIW